MNVLDDYIQRGVHLALARRYAAAGMPVSEPPVIPYLVLFPRLYRLGRPWRRFCLSRRSRK